MRLEPRILPCRVCRATKPCPHPRPEFDRCSTLVDLDGVMVVDLTGHEEEDTHEPIRPRR